MEIGREQFNEQSIRHIIKKYQRMGFNGLELHDLAVAIVVPEFNQYFIRQTGHDWGTKYERQALEKL